jgi:hypothetical protein
MGKMMINHGISGFASFESKATRKILDVWWECMGRWILNGDCIFLSVHVQSLYMMYMSPHELKLWECLFRVKVWDGQKNMWRSYLLEVTEMNRLVVIQGGLKLHLERQAHFAAHTLHQEENVNNPEISCKNKKTLLIPTKWGPRMMYRSSTQTCASTGYIMVYTCIWYVLAYICIDVYG